MFNRNHHSQNNGNGAFNLQYFNGDGGYRAVNVCSTFRCSTHHLYRQNQCSATTNTTGTIHLVYQMVIVNTEISIYFPTSPIDVADGLVNGAIGVLLYIERQPANADDRSAPGGPSTSTSLPPAEDEIATLWFQFEDKNTGTKAKIKCRPHVHSKPNTLSVDWVPVHKKVVNISLTKTVKCKRKQFPCVPACAITIHKAQEKDSPLVFKHGRDGNDSQTTRDIRNEYLRLRGHTLDTITKQAVKFCDDATDAGQLIVTNINCQSLSAHAADIETDTVIPRSDYLVLTETWMRDTCEPTPIKGYECVSRENNRPNSDTNAAGGVAIYRKLSSTSTAEVFQVAITDVTRVIKTKGDMCMTEVTCFAANTSFKFILGAVYIHPGASMQDIGMLLWQGLGPYIHNSQYVPPTISRRLVANGLHSCRPLRRLPLTPPNRRQRLEWCRARSTWMTEWHRVVFSDESRFCLSSDSRRVRVWSRRGERSNPAAIVERPTVRQRGIMVWGAIAYDSRSPLLRIQGTMTARRYVDDVLRPVTLPYLQGVPNALYQQDNARPHTARISQQALQDVQMLPWPPYSPDLSPIEHVWDIIGRRLHALPQPRSEDELWQMVEREWRAIPQDAIRTLIDSLPRRVAACIAVRGGPTCY
ncbi:hypothetical protein LAZ67_2002643 [Cordylochernes scorpioides]|uniref:Transposable element Tc1 transposase n=1 Tax=Cordylochernes scorpioides TaxID=51811 RepID=A0ABY6K3V2_9ARAC|nr:hypothetical protein LAZ67_2002643 [Cordylochernes scorpioides]